MYKESGFDVTAAEIKILVAIDADKLVKEVEQGKYPRNKTKDSPYPITHENQYMLCADPYPNGVISGQGTGDLSFFAKKYDWVSFTGTSIHNNATNAVIIYHLEHNYGEEVLDITGLRQRVYPLEAAAQPDSRQRDGMPALHRPRSFEVLDTRITGKGTENFWVWFGLYELGDDRETQNLVGYYKWDPAITTVQPK
ncbi:inclusion body family protein [Burkholderia sp. AU30280]|uniref:inclusion body family protein n=1 Tax=Burkholderia sp. AU30280 TaxID=2879628 RepID=UPI001CF429F5|nr:inclusion body family protein [Burkholderia sp. AU30280]MCA8273309.1 inclusion body family protein [Burkholderia sp. AU30280]